MLLVEDVTAGYGTSMVLSGVSLRVEPGQIVCLMGRNGVGKSTFLKTVMGVLRAQSGRIRFGTRDLTTAPPHARARAGIGYVPQGRGIFPYLTVAENLLMGLEAAGRWASNADNTDNTDNPNGTNGADTARERRRASTGIDQMYSLFPVLGEMAGRVAGTLSGGQQQQLAIARALISRPSLLLLDEPTEGIQPSIVEEIEALLQALRTQRAASILLVEQFLDFALSVADYCYVMEKGTIVFEGSADQLSQEVVREHLSV